MKQVIKIETIELYWFDWQPWSYFKVDLRKEKRTPFPNQESGVYEVKRINEEHRLTIGKSLNLRRRIVEALVKGNYEHSAGKRIRKNENFDNFLIRWAYTEYISCAEEYLHKIHLKKFNKFPEYTINT